MANLAPTQVEQLQRIGAYLRQVRQEQGLSLDALANQIFIRPALLQALETGRDDQLPEPVFIQGFIRRYAEALGLDGKAISQEFVVMPASVLAAPVVSSPAVAPTPTPPAAQAEVKPEVSVPPVQPPAGKNGQVAEKRVSYPISVESRRSGFPLWLALVAAALLVSGGLWALLGRNPTPETTTNSTPPEVAPTPSETPSATATPPGNTDSNDTAATTTPEASPDTASDTAADSTTPDPTDDPSAALDSPIVVTANLSDRAWLSVVADGRTVYEGTPEEGYEETWTAENSLVFTTGNAGGVSLAVNGEDPTVLGEAGVVREITITPTSDASTLETP